MVVTDIRRLEMEGTVNEHIEQQKGTDSNLLRLFANVVSYITHPIFMPSVMAYVLYLLSPISFVQYDDKALPMVFIQIIVGTVFFPLVVVLVARGLGFVQSVQMKTQKERIIPLIATMIFYWWVSHVFKSNDAPVILQVLLRGAYWAIIVLFICSIFFKISMHTMAAGGMLGILTRLMMMSPVEMSIPLFAGIFIAGLIGTARLLLGAHTVFEIVVGYILGYLVQFGAYWYVM